VEPVIQNEHLKKYSEPLLTTVDGFGCRQLDRIENASTKIADSYCSSKQMIEQKVATVTQDIKATASTLGEMAQTKLVPPVDDYLKTSVLSYPINTVLNVTEKVCDTILPAKPQEEEEMKPAEGGPVLRAGRMTKKYQKRAMTKLQNLSLRTPDQISAMKFTVDLIQYAATQIDTSAKAAQQLVDESVHKGVEMTANLPKIVMEKNQQQITKFKAEALTLTNDALSALHSAIDTLSKHVPPSVAAVPLSVYEVLKERTHNIASRLETLKDVANFSAVAKKSAEMLREASVLIQAAADKAEAVLPPQVITIFSSVLDMLNSVLPKPLMLKPKEEKVEKIE